MLNKYSFFKIISAAAFAALVLPVLAAGCKNQVKDNPKSHPVLEKTVYAYLKIVQDKNWRKAAGYWDSAKLDVFKKRIDSFPPNVVFLALEPKDAYEHKLSDIDALYEYEKKKREEEEKNKSKEDNEEDDEDDAKKAKKKAPTMPGLMDVFVAVERQTENMIYVKKERWLQVWSYNKKERAWKLVSEETVGDKDKNKYQD